MRKLVPEDGARARRRSPRPRKVGTSTKATKFAVSFAPDLASQVYKAAERTTKGNLSAWLAEAARNELRRDYGLQLVAEWEAERGRPYSEEELEASRKRLGF